MQKDTLTLRKEHAEEDLDEYDDDETYFIVSITLHLINDGSCHRTKKYIIMTRDIYFLAKYRNTYLLHMLDDKALMVPKAIGL